MGYLITQIIFCLLIAVLIGFILGWFLRGLGRKDAITNRKTSPNFSIASTKKTSSSLPSNKENPDTPESSNQADDYYPKPVTRAPALSHNVDKIEGVGKFLGSKLKKIGILTTRQLVKTCSTESGFQQVLEVTKATEPAVTQWLCMADLMRLPNINGHIAELMFASGIKSSEILINTDPQELVEEMLNVNSHRKKKIPATLELPDVNKIEEMIKAAKTF